MKDLAFKIKDDKSLWEKTEPTEYCNVCLLVEEDYYDGIVEDIEKLQSEMNSTEPLDAVIKHHLSELRHREKLGFEVERELEVFNELKDDLEFYDALSELVFRHALRINDEL